MSTEAPEQAQAVPAAEATPPPAAVEATPVVIADPVAHFDKMAEAAAVGDTETYNRLEKEFADSHAQPKAEEAAKEPPAPAPAEEETPVQPIAAEAAEIEDQETESGETPTQEKTPDRFRFKDDADRAVAMLAKAKKISLVEAAKLYAAERPQEVVKEPVAAPAQQDTTITDMEAEVAAIEAKMDEAGADEGLFTPQIAKLTQQLSKANAKLEATRQSAKTLADVKTISAAERVQQSEAQLKQAWKTQEAEAVKLFPDMANPNSALAVIARGLAAQMQDPEHSLNAGHPLKSRLSEADAPRFLAEEAAKLLKIVPQVAKPAAPTPAKTTAPTKEVARPAPGSRTTAPPAAEKTAQDILAEAEAETVRMISGGYPASKTGVIIL